jgi:hypothetical protein
MDVLPDNRTHHILSTFCRNNSTASSAVFPDRLYQLIRSGYSFSNSNDSGLSFNNPSSPSSRVMTVVKQTAD